MDSSKSKILEVLSILRSARPTTEKEVEELYVLIKEMYTVSAEIGVLVDRAVIVSSFLEADGPTVVTEFTQRLEAVDGPCGASIKGFVSVLATITWILLYGDDVCCSRIITAGLLQTVLKYMDCRTKCTCTKHACPKDAYYRLAKSIVLKLIEQMMWMTRAASDLTQEMRDAVRDYLLLQREVAPFLEVKALTLLVDSTLGDIPTDLSNDTIVRLICYLSQIHEKGAPEDTLTVDGVSVTLNLWFYPMLKSIFKLHKMKRLDWEILQNESNDRYKKMGNEGLCQALASSLSSSCILTDGELARSLELLLEVLDDSNVWCLLNAKEGILELLFRFHSSAADATAKDAVASIYQKLCDVAVDVEEKCQHVQRSLSHRIEVGESCKKCEPLLHIHSAVVECVRRQAASPERCQLLLSPLPSHVKQAFGRKRHDDGRTLLFLAVLNGDLPLVECIFCHCQPNTEDLSECDLINDDKLFMTPLHLAARTSKLSVVKFLLEHGANTNTFCGSYSPLQACLSRHNDLEIVRLLVSYGADVNATNSSGKTALMYSRSKAISQFLLNEGADVNLTAKAGQTALTEIVEFCDSSVVDEPDQTDIVQLLMQHGASTEVLVHGSSLLVLAALQAPEPVLEHLLEVLDPEPDELATTHELLGSWYYLETSSTELAMEAWKSGLGVRQRFHVQWELDTTAKEYGLTWAVKSVEDLEQLSSGELSRYALCLREQILGPGHKMTLKALWKHVKVYGIAELKDYRVTCSRVLRAQHMHLLEYWPHPLVHTACTYLTIQLFSEVAKRHPTVIVGNCYSTVALEEILFILDMTLLGASQWKLTSRAKPVLKADSKEIKRQMGLILKVIGVLSQMEHRCPEPDKKRITEAVETVVELDLKEPSGDYSLLHFSTNIDISMTSDPDDDIKVTSLEGNHLLVDLLLRCGADVNAMDGDKNTTLHSLGPQALYFDTQKELSPTNAYPYAVAELLLQHGAHLDAKNNCGKRASQSLDDIGHKYIKPVLSLQCLAAQQIMAKRLPYKEYNLPDHLLQFVTMH